MQHATDSITSGQILHLGQALFYHCGLEEKIPVSIIHPFNVEGGKTIWFSVYSLPVITESSNVFAGELFFYRKSVPYCITLEGLAYVASAASPVIRFEVAQMHHRILATGIETER